MTVQEVMDGRGQAVVVPPPNISEADRLLLETQRKHYLGLVAAIEHRLGIRRCQCAKCGAPLPR